jgi:aspartyl-tRNA(Asn)/glutamyl-tRNA(Gln) amidotransferase subunit A
MIISEAYAYHEATFRRRSEDYAEGLRHRIMEGAFITAADYVQAQRARSVIRAGVQEVLARVDIIASPAGSRQADAFDSIDPQAMYKGAGYTHVYNLTGLPAMSIPCGFTKLGLPIGLQLAGRAFDEATVFATAHAYEQATDWHLKTPDI